LDENHQETLQRTGLPLSSGTIFLWYRPRHSVVSDVDPQALSPERFAFKQTAMIFFFGLMLATVRLKTNSVLLCSVMHAIMNLIATIEVELFLLES